MSTVTRTRGSVCQDWDKRIQADRRELERLRTDRAHSIDRLAELEKAPSPDAAEIAALKARIAMLEAQIAERIAAINADEVNYQFFCS